MKKLLLLITVLVFSQWSFSQKKTRADRFFEKGDYINAAKFYELNLEQRSAKEDVKRIITSYYNTFNYRKAAVYLRVLVHGKFEEEDKAYDNNFNFKYYHVLSAIGDYEKALEYYKLYKENNKGTLDVDTAIKEIEEFKLKTSDYKIREARFNSKASDFGAFKVGDSVYFSSDRKTNQLLSKTYKWTHERFLDIYSVKLDKNLNIEGVVKPLPKIINSELHESNICFSADGKTAYLSRSEPRKGFFKRLFNVSNNQIHIYKTTKTDTTSWTPLERLVFNQEGYSYQHAMLSPDEKRIYFSSNQPGGYGSFDLYYAPIFPDGSVGEPINLGPTINTEQREHFPFISKEGHLFFSSNGHLGLGMLDIFVSENNEGTLTKPINLGAPLNSQYDDFNLNYYDAENAFFASNRKNVNDNIFEARQIGEIFIREYINTIEIRDIETKKVVPNVDVVLNNDNGAAIYTNTLSDNGTFNLNLLAGNYDLKASTRDSLYYSNSKIIKVLEREHQTHVLYLKRLPPPDPEDIIAEQKHIDKKLKENDPVKFELLVDNEGPSVVEKDGKLYFEVPPIYFNYDKWDIREDSKQVLDDLAKKLERYPKIRIKIISHTDNRGTARYNQILSERRAESTRNYLALEAYINARRMSFEGKGEFEPIIPCEPGQCSDEEHQLNRRSEFEILEY